MSCDRPSPISTTHVWSRRLRGSLAGLSALAALLIGLSPGSAEAAGLVLQVNNSTAPTGGTGAFDVVLIDTGGTFQISGFSVELTIGGSGVQSTDVTAGTTSTPYLFGTMQMPPLSFDTFPNADFIASDTYMSDPGYVTINGGTVGIEHVTYSVAAGMTPGTTIPLSINTSGSTTEILDANGALIPFTTTDGSITVTSAAVPEPASIIPLTIAMTTLGIGLHRRRSRRRKA